MKNHLAINSLVLAFIFPFLAAATSPRLPTGCEAILGIKPELPITLPYLSSVAREEIKVERVMQPPRNFYNVDGESRIVRKGVKGPKALQEIIGPYALFPAVPSTNSPTDVTVGSPEDVSISIPLRIETMWNGQPAGTLIFASLPFAMVPNTSPFIIGPQYSYVDIHLHGGGTGNARAENSISLGTSLGKRGIAVMGIDLPGHGEGPAASILTMAQISDWLADIIDRTVDPSVKITLSGHSWGGMLAVYIRNNSQNPRYARILDAISLSPGVDITLGGDVKKKLEFDRWYDDHYHELEQFIAPSDFEFLSTSVENDKLSTLGVYATVASQLDYVTPVMTLEEQKPLINMLLITGKADGLVYVGREKAYEAAWGNLKEGSEMVLLGPGTTFKSKNKDDLFMTGHQTFDLQIPGTTTALVYKMIADRILKGESESKVSSRAPAPTKIQNILSEITRQYSHFFPFRKLVDNFVRYKRVPTPNLPTVSARKRALDEFVNKATSTTAKINAERTKALQKATEALRAEIGINDKLDLARAEEEMGFAPLTNDRKKILENFISAAGQIEGLLKAAGDDAQFKEESQQLWDKHSEFLFLQGVRELSDYTKIFAEYQNMKKEQLTNEKKRIRSQLAAIDQEFKRLEGEKATRFGNERKRRISELGALHNIVDVKAASRELTADRSPERRAKLEAFVKRFPEMAQKLNDEFDQQVETEVQKLPKPDGITTVEEAKLAAQKQEALLGMMLTIEDQPEIKAIAEEIQSVVANKEVIQRGTTPNTGVEKLETQLRELKAERERQIKRWDALIKDGDLTSPKIQAQKQAYKSTLEVLKEAHRAMALAIDEYLQTQFIAHNTITRQMIVDRPQSLRDLENNFMQARLTFMKVQTDLKDLYTSEALKDLTESKGTEEEKEGGLTGSDAIEAIQLAVDLDANSPFSITARVQILDQKVEELREQESILAQKKERLHWQYAQLMKQKGLQAPYDIERIEVYSLLDLPLEQLMQRLEQDQFLVDALQDLLNTWKPLAKKLRNENQLSD